MSLAPIDWANIPEKLCFVACPDDVPCECRDRIASEVDLADVLGYGPSSPGWLEPGR